MGLRFDPVGGGQFKQAVKQIIEAESLPIKQMEARKSREEAKMKLLQEFKGKFANMDKALNELSSFQKFREFKIELGDGEKYASVTVDKDKAQPGSYQIQIDQLAARTSVISNGFASPDEAVMGIGYINMSLAEGGSTEIYVDDSDSSLNGIASLINKQQDSPVRAAVVKDESDPDEPWKIIMTAKKDGANNSVEFPEFYFLDGSSDFYIDDDHDAKNAEIQVDGFPIELSSNTVTDFLPGVNLHLKQAKPDEPFTLTITEDNKKIAGKVKGMVDELNKVLEFIVKQNTIDESTDTRTTFAGDSSLQNIEYKLRNILHERYPVIDYVTGEVRVVHLEKLGIEFEKNGTLSFKEDKFTKALESDYEGVSQAVSGEMGLAQQLREAISGFTRVGSGMISTREQGLRSRIREIDTQIANKQRNIDRRQQSLTEQFSRLQASLGAMQRQSQYLSAALPGAGGGGNIVSQLLGG